MFLEGDDPIGGPRDPRCAGSPYRRARPAGPAGAESNREDRSAVNAMAD
jgi:hypothetical protein